MLLWIKLFWKDWKEKTGLSAFYREKFCLACVQWTTNYTPHLGERKESMWVQQNVSGAEIWPSRTLSSPFECQSDSFKDRTESTFQKGHNMRSFSCFMTSFTVQHHFNWSKVRDSPFHFTSPEIPHIREKSHDFFTLQRFAAGSLSSIAFKKVFK